MRIVIEQLLRGSRGWFVYDADAELYLHSDGHWHKSMFYRNKWGDLDTMQQAADLVKTYCGEKELALEEKKESRIVIEKMDGLGWFIYNMDTRLYLHSDGHWHKSMCNAWRDKWGYLDTRQQAEDLVKKYCGEKELALEEAEKEESIWEGVW